MCCSKVTYDALGRLAPTKSPPLSLALGFYIYPVAACDVPIKLLVATETVGGASRDIGLSIFQFYSGVGLASASDVNV